jgi:SCY1-like protein 1
MVREQATKTMELFLQRVKKYADTLPDTTQDNALGASSQPGNGRPAAAQHESSWTGWAISSFTNKLSTVSGQMDETGTITPTPEIRSQSVPQMTGPSKPPSMPGSQRPVAPQSGLGKTTTQNPFAQSSIPLKSEPVEEFDDTWGEDQNGWGDETAPDFDPFAPKAAEAPANEFDDKGEPDFASWLNSQSKSKAKKPLPKGLAKPTKTVVSRPAAKASTIVAKPKLVKPEAAPKKEEEEDWGDAWD